MKKIIDVGIGEFKVTKAPGMLITHNLGSCVGIALYDISSKIGGLAHIMLPSYKKINAAQNHNPKFADAAIPLMIKEMEKIGAQKIFTVGKIAGGGDMFGLPPDSPLELNIGKQNIEMVKKYLQKYGIRIVAEEILGNIPRTMGLDLDTGKVTLKTAQKEERVL